MRLSERVRAGSEAAPWVVEEIRELERSVSEYDLCNKLQAQSVCELSKELEEAERKLAEQQAQHARLRSWFKKDNSCTCETCWSCAGKGAAVLSETANAEELTTLLAKAKEEGRREAVQAVNPVGMFVSYEELDENFKSGVTHYIEANSEELKMGVAFPLYAAAPKP